MGTQMGDGVLVEFVSAVKAITYAVALQKQITQQISACRTIDISYCGSVSIFAT